MVKRKNVLEELEEQIFFLKMIDIRFFIQAGRDEEAKERISKVRNLKLRQYLKEYRHFKLKDFEILDYATVGFAIVLCASGINIVEDLEEYYVFLKRKEGLLGEVLVDCMCEYGLNDYTIEEVCRRMVEEKKETA